MAATETDTGTSFTHPKIENGEDKHKEDTKELKGKESDTTQVKTKLQKEKKIGHRRVDASTGLTTYKKTPSSALSGSIQRGISHTVAGLSSKPERDVLMQDFQVVETITFPSEGSSITPAHHFGDFVFRTYAPTAFRYFRDLFGIRPDDYMLSISQPLTELSNPGASGSLFFVTHDDEFIIKTVQHKEAEFLQKLLPGYYMNLVQNPRTLLPKFYGLYCVQSGGKNIRIVVMNNLLPSKIKMHLKYDLKGSTYKRKASKYERAKKNPVYKDLDLLNDLPDGLLLEPEIHTALIKTMQRDCLVLQSFKIMDYSMLLAIHNLDQAKESALAASKQDASSPLVEKSKSAEHKRSNSSDYNSDDTATSSSVVGGSKGGYTNRNAVISSTMLRNKYSNDLEMWAGGIPARNSKGERLLLFCGIIDILQCYKFKKKLEHTLKAMIADADTVSVHRPAFYCKRFQGYMIDNVFKKDPAKAQSNLRTRLHSSKRSNSQVPTSSTTLPSSLIRLQGRPDLLPNESPRPALAKDGEETSVTKQEFLPTLKVIQRHQSVAPRMETTFEASPDLKEESDQHSNSSDEVESEKVPDEAPPSDTIGSEEVELSLDVKAPPVEEQSPTEGGDSVEVEVKTVEDVAPSHEETAL